MNQRLQTDMIYLLAGLLEGKNLAECANELNLSVSAVSKKLKKAEEVLGMPLFARMNGRLIPSKEILSLRPYLEGVVQNLEAISGKASQSMRKMPVLRICMNQWADLLLEPDDFVVFTQENDVRFESVWMSIEASEKALLNDEVDFAILDFPCQDLDCSLIKEAKPGIFVRKGGRHDQPKPISLRDLRDLHCVYGIEMQNYIRHMLDHWEGEMTSAVFNIDKHAKTLDDDMVIFSFDLMAGILSGSLRFIPVQDLDADMIYFCIAKNKSGNEIFRRVRRGIEKRHGN